MKGKRKKSQWAKRELDFKAQRVGNSNVLVLLHHTTVHTSMESPEQHYWVHSKITCTTEGGCLVKPLPFLVHEN